MLQARFNRQMRTRGNSSVIFYKLAITPRYKAYSKTISKHKCALIVDEHKLDNPAWNSLSETHQRQSIAFEAIQFYDPNYCAFGGATDTEIAAKGIEHYSKLVNRFFIIGEKPSLKKFLSLKNNLVCNQMILKTPIETELHENIVALHEKKQQQEVHELVNLVQPGYFRNKTVALGDYFGIYKGNTLVAVCGERMKMNAFTEISAIVTHPNHTRKGYAKQLIKHTTDKVFLENKIPYLHVLESNIHAISLYEKLGFITRRKISFWEIELTN